MLNLLECCYNMHMIVVAGETHWAAVCCTPPASPRGLQTYKTGYDVAMGANSLLHTVCTLLLSTSCMLLHTFVTLTNPFNAPHPHQRAQSTYNKVISSAPLALINQPHVVFL